MEVKKQEGLINLIETLSFGSLSSFYIFSSMLRHSLSPSNCRLFGISLLESFLIDRFRFNLEPSLSLLQKRRLNVLILLASSPKLNCRVDLSYLPVSASCFPAVAYRGYY
jgi:hypothetical protein